MLNFNPLFVKILIFIIAFYIFSSIMYYIAFHEIDLSKIVIALLILAYTTVDFNKNMSLILFFVAFTIYLSYDSKILKNIFSKIKTSKE